MFRVYGEKYDNRRNVGFSLSYFDFHCCKCPHIILSNPVVSIPWYTVFARARDDMSTAATDYCSSKTITIVSRSCAHRALDDAPLLPSFQLQTQLRNAPASGANEERVPILYWMSLPVFALCVLSG